MVDIHSDEYIIGQNIRKYRKQKGWSQKDLSDAVDVDRANISGIENGERGVMNCVMLKRFARALGVSMDTLMDEEDEPPCADTSIQEKYDMLNPMHQEMVRESIDCYLLKEQKVAILRSYSTKQTVRAFFYAYNVVNSKMYQI